MLPAYSPAIFYFLYDYRRFPWWLFPYLFSLHIMLAPPILCCSLDDIICLILIQINYLYNAFLNAHSLQSALN